jgi:hypothetical protein
VILNKTVKKQWRRVYFTEVGMQIFYRLWKEERNWCVLKFAGPGLLKNTFLKITRVIYTLVEKLRQMSRNKIIKMYNPMLF